MYVLVSLVVVSISREGSTCCVDSTRSTSEKSGNKK